MLSKVFKEFEGNEIYLDMCLKSLKNELKSPFSDFESEFYLIYENGKPASGAGLFYSKKGDFAYLHNAGTLKESRGKGHQTALIRNRAKKAVKKDINNIYTIVELGSQSWSNCIKNGFNQIQNIHILAKN